MKKYLVMAVLGFFLVAPVSAKLGDGQLRTDFKEKLAKIKDERKKNLIEKFDRQVAELNVRRTAELSKILEQMVVKGAVVGVDTAREAISVQAAKVYTTVFSDETKLRESANVVKAQLMADLKVVQEKVKFVRLSLKK